MSCTQATPITRCRGIQALGGPALLWAVLSFTSPTAVASAPTTIRFQIDAPLLSTALIQLSRQSDLSIVFSDHALRGLPADTLSGNFTLDEALDRLLEDSGLHWELVDQSVIAVFADNCPDCPNPRELLDSHPVYVPGLEETYVYSTRVTGSRIRRSSYTGGGPVDIITRNEMELSGSQSIGELLKFVPAVSGNATSTADLGSDVNFMRIANVNSDVCLACHVK